MSTPADRETRMSINLFLLFNHRITSIQESDARNNLDVARIVDMPAELKTLWRFIPPDLERISSYLDPIKGWLLQHAQKSDYVLIQGDFGACFVMVNFTFEQGLIPLYSASPRDAHELYREDGSVKLTHNFRHRIFRKYEK